MISEVDFINFKHLLHVYYDHVGLSAEALHNFLQGKSAQAYIGCLQKNKVSADENN